MNDDLAQCDVLGASWQAQHGACQGPEGLLCSLLQVSQMHLPGKIWARKVGLMPGAVSSALYCYISIFIHLGSGLCTGKNNCEENLRLLFYTIYRGSRDLSLTLRSSLHVFWVWEGKDKICHPWKLHSGERVVLFPLSLSFFVGFYWSLRRKKMFVLNTPFCIIKLYFFQPFRYSVLVCCYLEFMFM